MNGNTVNPGNPDNTLFENPDQLTLLVVEDDLGLQRLVKKRLGRKGYNVSTAGSGKEAIAFVLAAKEKELMLLLDFRLGDMSGKEVVDALKAEGVSLPFVIMTGHGDERTAVEMMKMGARDYLVKDEAFLDILPQVIENVINRLLIESRLTRAEQALHESEKRFRLIFNSGTDAIFLNEVEGFQPGNFIEVNEIACKRLGYSREELLTMKIGDIEDPAWKSEYPEQREEPGEKKRLLYEMVHLSKGGKRIPVEVNSRLIDFGGKPAFLSISRDITERKQLEEQLRQAQKMEAIGKLAGGLAHDFNNLLTTINGYAELLLLKIAIDSPYREGVKKIKKAGEKAASLTQQLLTFSRKQVLQPRLLDVNHLLRGIENTLKRVIPNHIEFDFQLEAGLNQIKADHDQIEQIIVNLSVNAGEAMMKNTRGVLTIKTENILIDEYYSNLVHDARPGRFVCLSIADSGEGMEPKTIQYIFEPFYSTKKVATGLGLSVVYGIVKQHSGWINVYSKPGKGTVFRVYFPVLEEYPGVVDKIDTGSPGVSLESLVGKGEKILLVDDENGIREKTAEYLSNYGYRVTEALNAAEAGEIFTREQGHFALIISNVELPDTSGTTLVEQLCAHQPTLKVLLSTGYMDSQLKDSGGKEKEYPLLFKPHSLADLLRKIKEVIG